MDFKIQPYQKNSSFFTLLKSLKPIFSTFNLYRLKYQTFSNWKSLKNNNLKKFKPLISTKLSFFKETYVSWWLKRCKTDPKDNLIKLIKLIDFHNLPISSFVRTFLPFEIHIRCPKSLPNLPPKRFTWHQEELQAI